jgi:signal transduction histidine kinase
MLKILFAEDDKVDRMAFERHVGKEGMPFDYVVAGSVREALMALKEQSFDAIITDYHLGDGIALDVLKAAADVPVIVTTGTGDEETAVAAMKAGAYDYLIKDPLRNYLKMLPVTVENAIKHKNAERALKEKQFEIENINAMLEMRVREEVAKSRDKDLMMIKQSRQAAMGEMIGNISHQWRQPLNALGLTIQDMLAAYRNNELTPDYMERSVAGAVNIIQQMSRTIDDFRNFFKPNKISTEFCIKKTIASTLSLIEKSLEHYSIRVEISGETRNVWGYPNEFGQAILNIIANAKDIVVERQVKNPVVSINISGKDGKTIIAISDNGGGIPEDIIDKIFEPYFTTKTQGTGIGLYMTKMIIVNHMNGRIYARNTGCGAEFIIEL